MGAPHIPEVQAFPGCGVVLTGVMPKKSKVKPLHSKGLQEQESPVYCRINFCAWLIVTMIVAFTDWEPVKMTMLVGLYFDFMRVLLLKRGTLDRRGR